MRRSVATAIVFAALLAGVASAPASAAGTDEESQRVTVVQGATARNLAPVAPGLVDWIEEQLRLAGVDATDGTDARIESDKLRRQARGKPVGTRALLAAAQLSGGDLAIITDVRFDKGRIELLLRTHRVIDGRLLGSGRAAAAATKVALAANAAIDSVLPVLGMPKRGRGDQGTITIDELSQRSRALELIDEGQVARAWAELEGETGPTVDLMRERIAEASERSEVTDLQKARLLAARGDAEGAWRTVAREASEQLYSPTPDVELLVTAGEINIQRKRNREARAYFERVLEVEPEHPDALVGLGKTLSEDDDPVGARDAYARARRARPDSMSTANALTSVGAPVERAAAHMEAGQLAGEMLQAGSASQHFKEAARLDPSISANAADQLGGLALGTGEGQQAASHFEQAIAQGGENATRQMGLGEALETLEEVQKAQTAYMRALELDPNDPEAMMKLGDIYLKKDEPNDAREMLELAVETDPTSAVAKRGLAKVMNAQGEHAGAVPLLVEAQELEGVTIEGLQELSEAQRKLGDLAAAEDALEQAIRLDPTNAGLRDELADVYEENGNEDAAAKQRGFVDLLGGAETLQADMGGAGGQRSKDPFVASMQELVEGFGPMMPGADRVVLLGVAENLSTQDRLLEWVWPMKLDKRKFAAALQKAIDPHYDRVTQPLFQALPPGSLKTVFDFGSKRALDAGVIATMNEEMISDAMFAAVVSRPTLVTPGKCGEEGGLQIELRRLGGQIPTEVQILAHKTCVSGDLLTHGVPNFKALIAPLVLLVIILIPSLRGFGTVAVVVHLPENTKSLVSASVTKRPRNVVSSAKTTQENQKGEFNHHLRKLKRGEKRLEDGVDVVFKWVMARNKPYFVTVRGPLLHSTSGDLIGDFLEERRVVVRKGHQSRVEFDLRPKDCPVEIQIFRGDVPAQSAGIAVKGQPDSHRFANGGSGFLYLGQGEFTAIIADHDRVAEREVSVTSFQPMSMTVDLAQEAGCVFTDCPEAVTPYMEGDYLGAADALERAGLKEAAHQIRADEFQRAGRIVEASRELSAAGRKQDAAALLDEHEVGQESAQLYEEAGEYGRAARIHAEAGDWVSAARNFEAAEDFERAIKCYEKLGETDTVLSLMEKSGDYLGAGKLCLEQDEVDRAIHNFQQVGRGDLSYGEVSRELGVILAQRGNTDFALEKFDEANQIDGIDGFEVSQAETYGSLLEDAGRKADALDALSAVRRKDLNFRDVNTRIETLKASITADEEATRVNEQSASMPPLGSASSSPGETGLGSAESRYEIIDELGRGGMGIVYKAKDTHLGRTVALKRLPDNLKNHPAAVKFFEREARSAAALNHPNIVTIFDAGQEADTYFISMEMLEGTPLDDVMENHKILPPIVVARLGIQIATGLAYAHRNKIIHRDIKTANLFLTRDKIVKIMDFGLAKMVEEVRKGATVIGGTPYYMAPEQATGEAVDHRADLYALGITIYQMSTGALPFTEGDITYHHRNTPPPDPRTFKQDLPAPLAALILKLIEKDPNARIQSADEVVQTLQAMVDAAAKQQAPS